MGFSSRLLVDAAIGNSCQLLVQSNFAPSDATIRSTFAPDLLLVRDLGKVRQYEMPIKKGGQMSIWTILAVILLIAWLGGFTVFHAAGGLIHLLLIFAVISFILHFVMGRRAA
jgi:Family of unknown function (DUF5670)